MLRSFKTPLASKPSSAHRQQGHERDGDSAPSHRQASVARKHAQPQRAGVQNKRGQQKRAALVRGKVVVQPQDCGGGGRRQAEAGWDLYCEPWPQHCRRMDG